MTQAYADVIQSMEWTRFVLVYENAFELARVGKLLQMDSLSIVVKELDASSDYR